MRPGSHATMANLHDESTKSKNIMYEATAMQRDNTKFSEGFSRDKAARVIQSFTAITDIDNNFADATTITHINNNSADTAITEIDTSPTITVTNDINNNPVCTTVVDVDTELADAAMELANTPTDADTITGRRLGSAAHDIASRLTDGHHTPHTDSDVQKGGEAESRLMTLPRELRDEIYMFAALEETEIRYDIVLNQKGGPPARRTVRTDRYPNSPDHKTRFEAEYAEAVLQRVRGLTIGGHTNGVRLFAPGPPQREMETKDIRIETSEGKRLDGKVCRDLHTLELIILFQPWCAEGTGHMTIAFKFQDKEELGPRTWSDGFWVTDGWGGHKPILTFDPDPDDKPVLQQVATTARDTYWKGAVREYMIWVRYIANYVRVKA